MYDNNSSSRKIAIISLYAGYKHVVHKHENWHSFLQNHSAYLKSYRPKTKHVYTHLNAILHAKIKYGNIWILKFFDLTTTKNNICLEPIFPRNTLC